MKHAIRLKGFTLIELLIVVAIIAILAAIAVPNFLEAQTRAKVSRAKSDLRTLATGLESYRIDYNAYPYGNPFNTALRRAGDPVDEPVLEVLSTPVAYLTTGGFLDPFRPKQRSGVPNSTTGAISPADFGNPDDEIYFSYMAGLPGGAGGVSAVWPASANNKPIYYYVTWSAGPDLIKTQVAGTGLLASSATIQATLNNIYDPTNGTISQGDVFRGGGQPTGNGDAGYSFFRAINLAAD